MFGFYNLLPYKVERMHYFPLAVIWCAPKADIHWNIIPKITIFSNNKKMFSYVGFHISLLRNAMTRSSCQRPNSTGTSRCQSFMCQDAIHREIYPNSFFFVGGLPYQPLPPKKYESLLSSLHLACYQILQIFPNFWVTNAHNLQVFIFSQTFQKFADLKKFAALPQMLPKY